MSKESNSIAQIVKQHTKEISNIQLTDINKTNKEQQIGIQDLQMRATVLKALCKTLKTRISETETSTEHIEKILSGLSMKPPPLVIDKFQPLKEELDNFPKVLHDINGMFRQIWERINQTKKWVELIPNINGRLEILEKMERPEIITYKI